MVQTVPIKGSCANYDFSAVMDKSGIIDTSMLVRVLRNDAPLYKEADSKNHQSLLKFGDSFLPLQEFKRFNKKRIQVRKVGTREPHGWIEGHDLLCGVKPLKSKDGLVDHKVFIKTPSRGDSSSSTVSVYKSNDQQCPTEGCQQLSRFRLYFIYAEDEINRRYLIIDKHSLQGASSPPPLVGWVKHDDTIPWNTTLGLRPQEDVASIFAYATLKDSQLDNRTEGVELTGGKIWYSFEQHIPILDIIGEHYHVAALSIGMQDHKVVDFYIPIDKQRVQEEVWMTANNLDDWLSLLKPFEKLHAWPARKQREVFVFLLRKQLQDILGTYPQQGLTLGEIAAQAKKKVLPMRQNGPLLQYKIEEIREIESCEVARLINWVISIRKVLQKVYNNSTQKPVFQLEYPTSKTYCDLSEKGKKVPELKFERVIRLGPDDNYRYDHSLYGQRIYWLPIDFLP